MLSKIGGIVRDASKKRVLPRAHAWVNKDNKNHETRCAGKKSRFANVVSGSKEGPKIFDKGE